MVPIVLDGKTKERVSVFLAAILVVFMTVKVAYGDTKWLAPPLMLLGFMLMLKLRPFWLCLLIATSWIPGRAPIMMRLGYIEILCVFVCGMWLLDMIITKRRAGKLYGWWTFWCIFGYCSILIWHVVGNKLGFRTGTAGGKRLAAVALMTICVCYVILSRRLQEGGLRYLPEFGLIPGVFLGGIEIINFLIPSAIYVTYLFHQELNFEAIWNVASSGRIQVSRLAELRSLGLFLGLYFGTKLVFTKRLNSAKGVALCACLVLSFVLVILSGFRRFVVVWMTAIILFAWLRDRRLTVVIIIVIVLCVAGLCVVQTTMTPLPYPIQRALCWLPGAWDPMIKAAANDGYKWRQDIWTLFMENVFPDNKWLGRGQFFDPSDAGLTVHYDPLYHFYYYQLLHSGFFSALDFVGIIGTGFFIAASLRAYYICIRLLTSLRRMLKPWMAWLVVSYIIQQPWYWVTSSFSAYMVCFSIYMAMFELVYYDVRNRPDSASPEDAVPEEL